MFTDRPIDGCKSDELERTGFARAIGDILINMPIGESICVGLMGPWGSGKTSIINMVIEYLKAEERTPRIGVMRFEPWNFTNSEQLVSQFFLQLAELFGVDQSEKTKIGSAITSYASGLENSLITSLLATTSPLGSLVSSAIKTGLKGIGKAVEGQAFENKSIQKQKDEIQDLLNNSEEKILIVIDDIDRLTDDQIRCVFQLVTVVCKFPNINYLLAFDRFIVSRALDQLQNNRGNEFLDKVIQVPISVPSISRNKLFSIMAYHMQELMNMYGISGIDAERWNHLYGFCTSRLINTQRDVLRLSNSLRSKLLLVSRDVNFEDLVTLTIIEQHEPALYEWISQHEEALTGQLSYESLHDLGSTDQDKHNRKEKYQEEIGLLLQHGNRFTTDFAIETLCILFQAFSSKIGGYHPHYDSDTLRRNNYVGHPLKFERFFSLNVNNEQIPFSELQRIMIETTEDEIVEAILEKDKNNASVELFDEIRARIRSLSLERAKVLISSLQQIGDSLKSISSNGITNRTASGEAMFLINEILRHVSVEDRYAILDRMISSMSASNINLTSYILYRISIAHNKITEERSTYDLFPSLSSDEELHMMEEKYHVRVKEIRKSIDPLQMLEKGYFMKFYGNYPEGKKYLIHTISAKPERLIYYLYTKTTQWHQSGHKSIDSLEITDGYKELITDDQIKTAISYYTEPEKISELELTQQRVVVAYLMKEESPTEYGSGKISIWDVDNRLKELFET